ncbi:hypothetical protein OY671_012308, partial [Metschnikowia pulcherrima]
QHHDLSLVVSNPVSQLDQFASQPQQFPEIDPAIQLRPFVRRVGVVEPAVVEFEFELLVEGLGHFAVDALAQGQFGVEVGCGHGNSSLVDGLWNEEPLTRHVTVM